ncbi:hypothetical protein PLICRDRAFT_177063 [Plicaturopsis crispa FD-325 SS-3]|nr:hypothetical protein PLICRDRAFT_177063 [Plicaturopsis crispa FD-325 SS-3]
MVIPAMDHIDQILATQSIDKELEPSIRAAVMMGKKTLNRYYDKTDYSEVYQIAMVLHPRHKLDYFKNANWEDSWIQAAKGIVEDEYEQSYADRKTAASSRAAAPQAVNVAKRVCYVRTRPKKRSRPLNL